MSCSFLYLTENFYKRFDGAVSITVVLKESENKVEDLSPTLRVRVPIKLLFFIFYVLLSQRCRKCLAMYMLAEKKHFLMYYAHVSDFTQ